MLVFKCAQYHDTATSGIEYSDLRILDRPCPVCVVKHVTVTRDGQFCERFRDVGSTHSNASGRGRHRLQPKRATSVSEVPSSQMEARNSNRSLVPEGSHGPRSSPKPLCQGGVGSSQASLAQPCIIGVMSQPLTGGLGCTTLASTAPTKAQHYQMTMTTSSPSRVFRGNPCSLPVSGGSVF